MGRPLTGNQKRVKLTLTVSPEVKDMLDLIRTQNKCSISELVEDSIRKEYRKQLKAEKNRT